MAAEGARLSLRVPTRLDRYPAKMVSRLAEQVVARYATGCEHLLDPFCGSGAILAAGLRSGYAVTGFDVNPYATLLSSVKLSGFQPARTRRCCDALLSLAESKAGRFPISWDAKDYWFTPATLEKYERLRFAARALRLNRTRSGRAVLLAMALSVRPCSRADQKSPKPFISKRAIEERCGRHYDPIRTVDRLIGELTSLYGTEEARAHVRVNRLDLPRARVLPGCDGGYTHVITSPPYLNAQDYYRSSKLELHILEGIIPFSQETLGYQFVGTERGDLLAGISEAEISRHYHLVPDLRKLAEQSRRHAAIVHRYLADMSRAVRAIRSVMRPNGILVMICGDNLVGGMHIRTWEAVNSIIEQNGFTMFDGFSDPIQNRMLAPKRQGHKGLIKAERVSAFTRIA